MAEPVTTQTHVVKPRFKRRVKKKRPNAILCFCATCLRAALVPLLLAAIVGKLVGIL